MRKRYAGYGVHESYAGYGITRDRAKALLKECRAGEHSGLVQKAAQQAAPVIAPWIVISIMEGKPLSKMEIEWELGEKERMPYCRNSFYTYRKFTLAILDRMLSGKEKA